MRTGRVRPGRIDVTGCGVASEVLSHTGGPRLGSLLGPDSHSHPRGSGRRGRV